MLASHYLGTLGLTPPNLVRAPAYLLLFMAGGREPECTAVAMSILVHASALCYSVPAAQQCRLAVKGNLFRMCRRARVEPWGLYPGVH